MSISAWVMATALTLMQAPDGFDQATLDRIYKEYTPAICMVTYTSELTAPNTGEVTKRDGSALGLIVIPTGLVMAPGHMQFENSEPFNISVSVGQGEKERKYAAKLLEKPEDINICFLQLESDTPLQLPYAQFTKGVTLELGQPLAIIGILSESLDFARGVTTCRVGAVLDKPRRTYALDTAVRFGFVSGPVFDARGRLVGIVGFDLSPGEGGDLYVRSGHPLVYQADLFAAYIGKPPSASEHKPPEEEAWLGVFTQPLNDDFAEYWGLPKEGGLVVSSIVAGSPAEAAGLKPGDVIVSFDGTPQHAKLDREVLGFTKLVRETGLGKTVPLKVLRGGQPVEMNVTLASRPKSARDAGEFQDDVLGLTVREITTDVRIILNLSEDVKGVIVRRVKSGSVANLAGMRPGVIIMNLGNFPVTSLEDYKKAVQRITQDKPDELTAFCRAGAATGFFRLEPRWNDGK